MTSAATHFTDTNTFRLTGGAILRIVYGYEVKEVGDDLVNVVDRAVQGFAKAATAGAYLVDSLPIREYSIADRDMCIEPALSVKHVPSWMPGGGWKIQGKLWRQEFDDMANLPYHFAKTNAVRSIE